MKAFVSAVVAAAVIAVVAALALNWLGHGTAEVYQSPSVRLDS